uniref:Uncharacterized protein n=1 Tax=Rhizophora mucronata TaxID=61149 RepID=A0A2P2QQD9_RHIMU
MNLHWRKSSLQNLQESQCTHPILQGTNDLSLDSCASGCIHYSRNLHSYTLDLL